MKNSYPLKNNGYIIIMEISVFSKLIIVLIFFNIRIGHSLYTSSFKVKCHVDTTTTIHIDQFSSFELCSNRHSSRSRSSILSRKCVHTKPTDFDKKNPWMIGFNDMINFPNDIMNLFILNKEDVEIKNKKNDINGFQIDYVSNENSAINKNSSSHMIIPTPQNNSYIELYIGKASEPINNRSKINSLDSKQLNINGASSASVGTILVSSTHFRDNNYKTNTSDSIDYYISSEIESIKPLDNKEKTTTRYPVVLSYLGDVLNKVNIFKGNKESKPSVITKAIDTTPPGVYVPKGLFGTAARLVRRRVLNILDRSPTNWANALSRDDDLYNVNTAIYVSKPWLRNAVNSSSIEVGINNEYAYSPDGNFPNVINTFKRIKKSVQRVSPFRKETVIDLRDAKLSVFDKMYRREIASSVVVPKPKLERFTRINNLMTTIANKTSNVFAFLTNNDEDESDEDILGIKILGPLFENKILDLNVNEAEKNSNNNNTFFSPVFKVFENIGNAIGSINKYKNEEETKNKDLAFNLLVTQQEKVNLIYSNGKELTTRTLKNLVQAGKETVDETRVKAIESVSNKIKEISNDKKELKNETASKFTFRFPWDIYYRAEIPFFENFSEKSKVIEMSKETHSLSLYVNNTSDFSKPVVHTTNIDQTEDKRKKPVVFVIIEKVFPISSFIISKIVYRVVPSKINEYNKPPVIDNMESFSWITPKKELDYLNYSPVTNQIPFPLITDPDIKSPYQYATEMAIVGANQPLLLTSDTTDLSELKSIQKISSKSLPEKSLKSMKSEKQSLPPSQEIISPSTFISSATAKIFSSIASVMNEAALRIQSQNSIQQPLEETETVEEVPQSNPNINQIDLDQPIKVGRATELRTRPTFLDRNQIPLPSKADFTFIFSKKIKIALAAALEVKSERDAEEFVKVIGLDPLISALVRNVSYSEEVDRIDIVKGICRLIREKKSLADEIAKTPAVISVLCDFMELPLRRFHMFQAQVDKDKDIIAQRESTALIQRLVRSSDKAIALLRNDLRLKRVLSQIVEQDAFESSITEKTLGKDVNTNSGNNDGKSLVKKKNSTTIIEYSNLKATQMARVASWGLGGVKWKPKQPGQKGLRILSFDGGGTRGVLSIACLKEIMKNVGGGKQPHEVFDIICGTSTGGIIAVLLGAQKKNLDIAETLYDDFIDKVFGQKSNLKLVTEQAFYDETALEAILYKMCGDQLLLDSNQVECPRVFCVSTKVNNNPPQTQVWRNYNYPPGQISRYPGTFRVNTITAVRATTAAPTFFTPVQWEDGLYCDGALVANNPTAIALQEAKILYPGVPVELVVSIGTGYINMGGSYMTSMGWDLLVNNLVASSTDTEDVHALLVDFLPKDKYFRFNPLLKNNLAIDEKNKSILTDLKSLARENFRTVIKGPDAKYYEQLFKTLKGNSK